MSLPQILLLTTTEIIGDFGFKTFANQGGILPFVLGTIGYIGVICSLILSLQNSTVLMVNSAWDGVSGIVESLAAYFFLGERLEDKWQYIGILFITMGLYLLKIPNKKEKPFIMPTFFKFTTTKSK
jgi:multidrug transporter EmrE-like cation transporter